jgi:hypothetical protein
MIRFRFLSVVAGVAICTAPGLAISQERTFTFKEIDKNKTLGDVVVAKKDPCPFISIDGKIYEACPNFKFDGLDSAIARFQAK